MQPRSMRVDPILYDRLAKLAQSRGTSITRQLEMAIRGHLEAAVVEDDLPVVAPALRRVIEENLEGTVTAKIDQMKERLASLLARNAVDTACLYLLQTHRMTPVELEGLRSHAVRHVRGKAVDVHTDEAVKQEVEALRRRVQGLSAELQQAETLAKDASNRHQAEVSRSQAEVNRLRQVLQWKSSLLNWLEAEWDKQGLLARRKPFQDCVREFRQRHPEPEGA